MAERAATPPLEIPDRTWMVWAISINLFIAFTRVLALRRSSLNLLPDEAQYWSWSRHLAFGYFSKPPMIAWLIRATTSLVGNDEWAVRLGAPLVHAATGIVVGFLGKSMFGARVGFFSALLYATLPGVTFSGLIISTDVPLLFFWALALFAAWHILIGQKSWIWPIVLGLALGFGFLSKYAMGYFLLGFATYAAFGAWPRVRTHWPRLAVALVVAMAIIAPNIYWNAVHGWATVGHTAANANWEQGGGLHLVEALQFAGAQFGVFGPVLLVALAARLVLWRRNPPDGAERFLLAFAVPVLVLMIVQSGISRAHANWAAVAYVSATVLVVGWLERIHTTWPIRLSLALQVLAFGGFTLLFAGSIPVRLSKEFDIFHQMRGWSALGERVWQRMGAMPADVSVAADDREVMAELDYYLRGRPFPLVMATGKGPAGNQYELDDAITPQTGARVLLIARFPDRHDILNRFQEHALSDVWGISAGDKRERQYYVYQLSGFKGD